MAVEKHTGTGPDTDPTSNVLALVTAAVTRLDDLRVLSMELASARVQHQKEISDVRGNCSKELGEIRERHSVILREMTDQHHKDQRSAESDRLNSIRQVDREDVGKTAAQALNAIQILQAQTNTTAETLRNQVATTAQQAAAQRAIDSAETNKRLSAVELALSEGRGKQTLADPQMEKLSAMVERLASMQAAGTGKTEGINWVWALIAGAVALIGGVIGIAATLYALLKP